MNVEITQYQNAFVEQDGHKYLRGGRQIGKTKTLCLDIEAHCGHPNPNIVVFAKTHYLLNLFFDRLQETIGEEMDRVGKTKARFKGTTIYGAIHIRQLPDELIPDRVYYEEAALFEEGVQFKSSTNTVQVGASTPRPYERDNDIEMDIEDMGGEVFWVPSYQAPFIDKSPLSDMFGQMSGPQFLVEMYAKRLEEQDWGDDI